MDDIYNTSTPTCFPSARPYIDTTTSTAYVIMSLTEILAFLLCLLTVICFAIYKCIWIKYSSSNTHDHVPLPQVVAAVPAQIVLSEADVELVSVASTPSNISVVDAMPVSQSRSHTSAFSQLTVVVQ